MDETYQAYIERVGRLTQASAFDSQLQNIQESPKFQPSSEGIREPAYFPGYSVISPPWRNDDEDNEGFYSQLAAFREELLAALGQDFLIPVPAASFHVTLADLIWDGAFRHAVETNPQFEEQLRHQIAESFAQYRGTTASGTPLLWQLLGLLVRPRALVVSLLPKEAIAYNRLVELRRAIYQNPELIRLGVEQQYYFTAHITLGYFGEIPADLDREAIATTLTRFNEKWIEIEPQIVTIKRGELRKFENMTRFEREDDFPAIEF